MKNKMLSIGDKMPKFSLLDQDGNEVNYQDLQKKKKKVFDALLTMKRLDITLLKKAFRENQV
jgi:peroxiredoxin